MKKHNVESPQESLPCISETRLTTLRPKGTKSDYDGSFNVIVNGQTIFGLQVASKVFGIICDAELGKPYALQETGRNSAKVKYGIWYIVKRLQYLLTHSFYAKLLATRKVTQNRGKRTAGIDGETWSSPKSKMKAALSLTDKKYVAKPLKRVFIEKPGKKKKRPLGIPTMYDRSMQSLYALALEPVAEIRLLQQFNYSKNIC